MFGLITIPRTVLIRANPSAPASITPRAIETISVTSGESLAIIGRSPPMVRRTPSITVCADSRWQAKTMPRFSTLGQEIFTSSAEIPATPRRRRAKEANSSAVSPAMETMTRAFCSTNQAKSLAKKASMPGPCRPIELSIPLGVSAIRGVARPARGLVIIDLVTIAPMSRRSKNCASSFPELAQPLAVKIGAGNQAFPKVVEKSNCVIRAPESCLRDPIRWLRHP